MRGDEQQRGWEKERQTEITRGDEEIKFHHTLKKSIQQDKWLLWRKFSSLYGASGAACHNMIMCPCLVVCVHYGMCCDERLRWFIFPSVSFPASHTAYLWTQSDSYTVGKNSLDSFGRNMPFTRLLMRPWGIQIFVGSVSSVPASTHLHTSFNYCSLCIPVDRISL